MVAALFAMVALAGCAGVGKQSSVGTSNGGTTPASISAQPASQTVSAGQSATFTVAASGTAPLTYQWRKNGVNISGATSASYTTPATTAVDDGAKFDVVVTNAMGSATSTVATLSVSSALSVKPAITTQPARKTVTTGQTATFTVVATGTPTPTYQWRMNTTNLSGATSASYTTPATVAGDTGEKFDVVVSNSAGSVTSASATLTVSAATAAKPVITTQPSNRTVTVGQTATFTVVATGTPSPAYQWRKGGVNISGATSATYVTPATAASDTGEKFDVVVSNSAGSVTSSAATLTVTAATASNFDVVTYHYDNLRTGQNTKETTLTHANVTHTKFGKLGKFPVDGRVDAQALYLSNLAISGQGTKNVLYVVTEHDTVYAFDADSLNGGGSAVKLWSHSVLASGEAPSDDRGCGQVTPEIGITATPVIDRARNAIYVVAMSKTSSGTYFHRIHALNLTTGAELFGGPTEIVASYPGSGANSSNGKVVFDAKAYKERPGLLQIGGTIYTTWSSHCDIAPYTSWVMSYSADTLDQLSVLNLVPNGNDGGIWMAGTAPAADPAGNIYFIVGNGDFGTSLGTNGLPTNGNCGNCFAKISSTAPMKLIDYFATSKTVDQSNGDIDFGSGGPLLLPDVTDSSGKARHLAIGSGKDTAIFVLDRDNMGKFNASKNSVYQEIDGQLSAGVFAKPSYFNGTVYYGAVQDSIKAFPVNTAKMATTPSSHTATTFGYPGATPVISANGTSEGIVWVVENGGTAVLHAYDATNLATELYNSNQAANGHDSFSGNKYITPIVANGKVFVGTPNSVVVFGLLP
jgi:Immunoglobulin domain/Immunoglobulin I-set domain